MAEIARSLRPGLHYEVDEDARNVQLTEAGARAAERALGGIDLYGGDQLDALTRLNVALHAHALLQRDVDYIVRDGRIQLVSASRGRVARLQRWPDGLQAAVEAKEALAASATGEILDSITVAVPGPALPAGVRHDRHRGRRRRASSASSTGWRWR